jgi:hypothetical protein
MFEGRVTVQNGLLSFLGLREVRIQLDSGLSVTLISSMYEAELAPGRRAVGLSRDAPAAIAKRDGEIGYH